MAEDVGVGVPEPSGLRPIETLSDLELRQEAATRISRALGSLPVGPVADGTGAFGFGREYGRTSLECSYVRFLKAIGQDEQPRGVQLELLRVFNGHSRELQEKDNLPFHDNRYYLIPTDPDQPVIVSTESFADRAFRANPEAFTGTLLKELLGKVKDDNGMASTTRQATQQDLRDAVDITRSYESFVKEIIGVTPHEFWGRSGLTE